jgi:hypothetical protein
MFRCPGRHQLEFVAQWDPQVCRVIDRPVTHGQLPWACLMTALCVFVQILRPTACLTPALKRDVKVTMQMPDPNETVLVALLGETQSRRPLTAIYSRSSGLKPEYIHAC